MKKVFYSVAALLVSLFFLSASSESPQDQGVSPRSSVVPVAPPPRLEAYYGKIPLQFVPNRGQAGEQAAYYVQGRDKTIFFSSEGLTFALSSDSLARWVVKLDFVDPNKDVRPVGLEESGSVISYFKGKPEDWKAGLTAYSRIVYRELWPGIDLVYSGTFDRMKYEFIVHPGADPARIRLTYRGAQVVRLAKDGRLEVETPAGSFQDEIPIAYQDVFGKRCGVPVAFALKEDSWDSSRIEQGNRGITYGFEVGEYDRSRTLILDPAVIVYCGFVGGSGSDSASDIAIDSWGNAYIAGVTSSADLTFPAIVGPDPSYNGGDSDAFVVKVDASGTALVYCGYLGGSGSDHAARLAVDGYGNAYVAGFTDSTESTFPVTVGPDLTYNGGDSDAFVAKVDASGTALVYCGYLGGAGMDRATSIDVGNSIVDPVPVPANAYIAGFTDSTEATFPVTLGPDLTYNGGESDAFVAEVSATGMSLVYCGYIGGNGRDEARGIARRDPGISAVQSQVWVVGATSSDESTFPVTGGPDLTYNGGTSDAFAACVYADAYRATTTICGYIGGSGEDEATGAVSASSFFEDEMTIYVTGTTSSTESTFPVAIGPDLIYNGGPSDAFIAEVSWDGSAHLPFCGYIGGSGSDVATDIALNYRFFILLDPLPSGASVVGYTSSTESTFPVVGGPDSTYNGGASDAFVAKVDLGYVGRLISCGYIGGPGEDEGWGIACYNPWDDDAYFRLTHIAGWTSSSEPSFPVAIGPDLAYNGGASDAFVAKTEVNKPILTSLLPSNVMAGEPALTLAVTGSDFLDGARVLWQGEYMTTTYISSTELHADIPAYCLAIGRAADVKVQNPDYEISDPLTFEVRNPVPVLASLSPASSQGGGSGFLLTVLGSAFVPGAVVLWNGNTKETTYVSSASVSAAISASDIANGGNMQVTVTNPAPTSGPSNAMVFPVSGYVIVSSPTSATVVAGQSATYNIQLTPQFGSFDSSVSFSCTNLPSKCTASFSPASVTPGAAAATTTLTLTTSSSQGITAAATFRMPDDLRAASNWLLVTLAVPVCFYFRKAVQRRSLRRWFIAGILVCSMFLIAGCGADTYTGTTKGSHQITVQGKSGNMAALTTVTLVVK